MKPKRIASALAALVCLLFTVGCFWMPNPEPVEANGFRFNDALGRDVVVDHPQRVVALMGSFADTWLLAGGTLVGITTDALTEWDLELSDNVSLVGMYNEPSLEAIFALNPDLVLLSSETAAHVALLDSLESAGITAAYFSVTHFPDYLEMLHTCTAITGRDDLYEKNGVVVEREIQTLLSSAAQREDSPLVLLALTWSGGISVQSSDTMAGRMLEEIGCDNLADRSPGVLREFSLEEIIIQDPDYLLVIPMGNSEELARKNLEESLESHPAWNSLTAVQRGQYHLLPKDLFLYKPNRSWADSYAYLLEILIHE